jgi:hypothetical protein
MSFAPNMTQKRCFVACHPDVVKNGGCSCRIFLTQKGNNLSVASNKVFRISNRIYKIKYILQYESKKQGHKI